MDSFDSHLDVAISDAGEAFRAVLSQASTGPFEYPANYRVVFQNVRPWNIRESVFILEIEQERIHSSRGERPQLLYEDLQVIDGHHTPISSGFAYHHHDYMHSPKNPQTASSWPLEMRHPPGYTYDYLPIFQPSPILGQERSGQSAPDLPPASFRVMRSENAAHNSQDVDIWLQQIVDSSRAWSLGIELLEPDFVNGEPGPPLDYSGLTRIYQEYKDELPQGYKSRWRYLMEIHRDYWVAVKNRFITEAPLFDIQAYKCILNQERDELKAAQIQLSRVFLEETQEVDGRSQGASPDMIAALGNVNRDLTQNNQKHVDLSGDYIKAFQRARWYRYKYEEARNTFKSAKIAFMEEDRPIIERYIKLTGALDGEHQQVASPDHRSQPTPSPARYTGTLLPDSDLSLFTPHRYPSTPSRTPNLIKPTFTSVGSSRMQYHDLHAGTKTSTPGIRYSPTVAKLNRIASKNIDAMEPTSFHELPPATSSTTSPIDPPSSPSPAKRRSPSKTQSPRKWRKTDSNLVRRMKPAVLKDNEEVEQRVELNMKASPEKDAIASSGKSAKKAMGVQSDIDTNFSMASVGMNVSPNTIIEPAVAQTKPEAKAVEAAKEKEKTEARLAESAARPTIKKNNMATKTSSAGEVAQSIASVSSRTELLVGKETGRDSQVDVEDEDDEDYRETEEDITEEVSLL